MNTNIQLGVNIDHIATLCQARGESYPDTLEAAQTLLSLGADYIVIHLRHDRRHIQETDLQKLCAAFAGKIHLEMAPTEEMLKLALKYKPGSVCLVPEYPNELTTSGGLKIEEKDKANLKQIIHRLQEAGIRVSLFIDPKANAVRTAYNLGADIVELCTKDYSKAKTQKQAQALLSEVSLCALLGRELNLEVHSGHGLTYENVREVALIDAMQCLNIGFSIIARSVFVGLPQALLEMRNLLYRE